MITDQQRAEFTRREGFPMDTMPFLDSLAAEGAWFDNAYTAAPICVAARVSLLTGRYPNSTQVTENRGACYAKYTKDMFDVMNENGYRTAMIGKNHTHVKSSVPTYCDYNYFHGGQTVEPEEKRFKEFDDWLKTLNGCQSNVPTPFPLECQMPHRIVTKAINWVDTLEKDDNFFLYVAFPEQHNPYQVPEPYFSMFSEDKIPPIETSAEDLKNKGFKWKFSRNGPTS
ncbi:MAG: sulfatase-like hydrolase/transferase [Spirochaetales bacterium]|nr:sulfatase-like hydrolase/transferase [Spirochaetales bacterium]